jgi:hypothetical protein
MDRPLTTPEENVRCRVAYLEGELIKGDSQLRLQALIGAASTVWVEVRDNAGIRKDYGETSSSSYSSCSSPCLRSSDALRPP